MRGYRCGMGWALVALVAQGAGAASISVNTATDDFGSNLANCSLREAIQSANGNADFGGCAHTGIYNDAITDVITLPTLGAGGAFTLSRFIANDDANASTDLDINGNLTINGVSTANTIIRGDTGAPDAERDRLVHVIGGNVTLRDMTLRDGRVGGSTAGGGLRTEPGTSVTLQRVVVGLNTAGGNAGGILNRGTMSLLASTVSNNQTLDAANGGGGIFISPAAELTLTDSRVLGNTANCVDNGVSDLCGGGGIYVGDGATLSVLNSSIEQNTVDAGLLQQESLAGGGILSPFDAAVVDIEQATIHANQIQRAGANDIIAGGAYLQGSGTSVRRSLISNNSVPPVTVVGFVGGLRLAGGELIDSIVSGNSSEEIGGVEALGARIVGSTLIGNSARVDAGATLFNATIVNSTVVGNTARDCCGGLRISGSSAGNGVYSTTVVANTVTAGSGTSGGIGASVSGGLTLVNSVIAGNSASTGADCSGTLVATRSLVQNSAGCSVVGDATLDVSAGLLPLANNGGPVVGASVATVTQAMLTRAPSPGSALLDAGVASGCRDDANALLATDQIGRPRSIDGPDPDTTARCDIGAVEFSDLLLRDGFE